jgi:HEAT repeat protein
VREAAAGALGELSVPDPLLIPLALARVAPMLPADPSAAATNALRAERVDRLEALIGTDQSAFVRAAALRSLATIERARALPATRTMLVRDGWMDAERRAALAALRAVGGEDAGGLAREMLPMLEARLDVEEDSRVREALRDAVEELRRIVLRDGSEGGRDRRTSSVDP